MTTDPVPDIAALQIRTPGDYAHARRLLDSWALRHNGGETAADERRLRQASNDLEALYDEVHAEPGAAAGITDETRAAVAQALAGRPDPDAANQDHSPRELYARAMFAAAHNGDDAGLRALGVEHRKHGNYTHLPVRAAQRAATDTGDIPNYLYNAGIYGLVRPDSVLAHLSIEPTLIADEGRQVAGWLTTAPPAKHVPEDPNLAQLDTEVTAWTTITANPGRWVDSRGATLEAEARWRGSYDELFQDVVANLTDGMEAEILTGDGTPGAGLIEWTGILHTAATGRANVAAQADSYNQAVQAIAGEVDGKWASRTEDLAIVMAPDMHKHLAGVTHPGSGMSVLDWIRANTKGARVSEHWPDIAGNVGKLLVRRGMRPGAVHWVVWNTIRLRATDAGSEGVGTRVVGVGLSDLQIPTAAVARRSDFELVEIRTAV